MTIAKLLSYLNESELDELAGLVSREKTIRAGFAALTSSEREGLKRGEVRLVVASIRERTGWPYGAIQRLIRELGYGE